MNAIHILSNRGWGETVLDVQDERPEHCLLRVEVTNRFWRRDLDEFRQVVDDSTIVLHQVCSGRAQLERLKDGMRDWLEHRRMFQVEMSKTLPPSLTFSLELDQNVICSPEKPVFVGRYIAEHPKIYTWGYVTDETCIRQALSEIEAVLAGW